MLDQTLQFLLGENFELLTKLVIFFTKKERWRITQSLLYLFGNDFQDETVILYFSLEQENIVKYLCDRLSLLLDIEINKRYIEKQNIWELRPKI
jgi:hypothetical protein